MLRIHSASHLFGETVVEHGFPQRHDEILDVLGSIELPLREAGPFTSGGRPNTPKRQRRKIGGKNGYALFPVDQGALNRELHTALRSIGWMAEPIASGRPLGTKADIALRGDFAKAGVFIEVEFGNTASLYRDLFKFQIANRSNTGEVAVLIVATSGLARFFDSGVATFEHAVSLLPSMRIGIQMPIWIIGIEPPSWEKIQKRYDEMYEVATENSIDCHAFAVIVQTPAEALLSWDEPAPTDDDGG